MERYDYVLVGAGMAADAAASAIREHDESGTIAVIGEESTPPVARPALSKDLWEDDAEEDDALLGTEDTEGLTLLLGRRAVTVDPEARMVATAEGDEVGYGELLLATSGRPKQIEGLEPSDRVLYFRTLDDYRALRELARHEPHVAVVGSGFIGTEIATALAGAGCQVTLLCPEDAVGAATFPSEVTSVLEQAFADAGVTLRTGASVAGGMQAGDGVSLDLGDEETLEADAVVLGLGIEPGAEPLVEGLERSEDGGIVVDARLRTSLEHVWAAGDVAAYPDAILGRRRVEHEDHAQQSGKAAGANMTGADEAYEHTPMFYSDLAGHGYEAVGVIDASLQTFVDGDPAGDGAVVYYADDEEVKGVLLWDSDVDVDDATALLAEHQRPADLSDLAGALA